MTNQDFIAALADARKTHNQGQYFTVVSGIRVYFYSDSDSFQVGDHFSSAHLAEAVQTCTRLIAERGAMQC